MSRLFAAGVAAAALIATTTLATANGVTYDKLAYLTFSAPVQVPGATLGAGTYRFRLANPGDSRNVLQVLSRNGSTVYANFHTIPDSRTALTNEPVVTFRETPAGVPPAIRSLFYGGELSGYEFIYPKGGPNMIPELAPQPAVTYTPIPAAIPEPVIEPKVWREPRPITEPVEEFAEPVEEEAAQVPQTATPLPWVAIGGLTSLLAGLGLGVLRRRRG
ncbi:MAG TPA: LPXTG cell wall anchor domain-containing protein [Vicinamibacterales bacterium]|nr:LPXTG cell wall anchor domain-containing protein [Vicinamibacterales bacterium]